MTGPVTLSYEGPIAIMTIDNPPVNALSYAVIDGIKAAFDTFEASECEALVIACAGRTFVAGADINTFDDADFSAAPFNALIGRIEASPRPVAAALFGTVLGGGLELAMACHIRVAHPATRLGLPEVHLGLIPGSLGTQRLPRLAGLAKAFEMISTGTPISAEHAVGAGIVDHIADDPKGAAIHAVADYAHSHQPPRRASELTIPDIDQAPEIIAQAKAAAEAKPFLPTLGAIAAALEAATRSFAEGERVEAAEFEKLRATTTSRALRHIFFAEREAQRVPGLPKDIQARPIKSVGIVGVGTMGGGIAMTFANAGIPVTLVETSQEALDRGIGIIEKNYAGTVSRGRLTEEAAKERRALMTGATGMEALAEADLIIEAVFEDMSLKLDVARKLGEVAKPGAIIATNTSTLDVDKIAEATGRPADALGTHFFSPAHIMKLLEVVRGAQTAPDVLYTVMKLSKTIGKTAVVSGVCYGFIGNRMTEMYLRESEAMILEGATPQQIDKVVESPRWLGLAMGPNRMGDMAGVDVMARIVNEWVESGEGPQAPSYRALVRALFHLGKFGQKTGEGLYLYEGRKPIPNPATEALAKELAAMHNIAPREHSEQEIFERLIYPMVNEAALILMEGIAYRPGDIDVVWTSGYGWPTWRGGPLFMADEIGVGEIVARMDHYAATLGNEHGYWTVAPLLRELAASGQRISDWRPAS
ncbi:enoyl-CoA hydratase [Acuticoccus sediminis]|uniref:Enoyl-CoA hydratase n=1 Tax=Acuticoccus sediminis TaxID=2184697 RepID=A0A8B2NRS3_9HYPH|nr:3-hydroxyacyl-CoA dehydrogenase NAD-binding domain-containing protein [Acuticoccus sediminis]RAI00053.1 enoyl-CoA hydratase [Acuticoccus sediminis]